MGRLIVTLMLVGPMSSQTLHLKVRRQNGSLCDRIVAIVGPIVAHNGEFCGLIYLFDCVHISLVSALSMMNPKMKLKVCQTTCTGGGQSASFSWTETSLREVFRRIRDR